MKLLKKPVTFLWGILTHRFAIVAYRVCLGLIFLYACIYKIADPSSFAAAIEKYEILPEFLINFTSITLPWIELFCGILLITGLRARSAALVTALLMLVFTVAVSINVARGNTFDCGCFTDPGKGETIGPITIVRDLALLLMSVAIVFYDKGYGRLKVIFEESD